VPSLGGAIAGLRAPVLVEQCRSPVKCEVSSQLLHFLMVWEQGLPLPAVQYRVSQWWSLVWWVSWQNSQLARRQQWAAWWPNCRHLSQWVEASLRMYLRKVALSPKKARQGLFRASCSLTQSVACTATMMDDFLFFSFCRTVRDLSHFGLSISLRPGLKEVISPF